MKAELADALQRRPSPLLILLDDLDRLTPAETLKMFQIVKANADLPNVVFLLLCDREIVVEHVASVIGGRGDDLVGGWLGSI